MKSLADIREIEDQSSTQPSPVFEQNPTTLRCHQPMIYDTTIYSTESPLGVEKTQCDMTSSKMIKDLSAVASTGNDVGACEQWTPSTENTWDGLLGPAFQVLHLLPSALPNEFRRAGDAATASALGGFSVFGLGLRRFWKELDFLVPLVPLAEFSAALADVAPPKEYRFCTPAGDSGVSGALVLGLLADRNLATADFVAVM